MTGGTTGRHVSPFRITFRWQIHLPAGRLGNTENLFSERAAPAVAEAFDLSLKEAEKKGKLASLASFQGRSISLAIDFTIATVTHGSPILLVARFRRYPDGLISAGSPAPTMLLPYAFVAGLYRGSGLAGARRLPPYGLAPIGSILIGQATVVGRRCAGLHAFARDRSTRAVSPAAVRADYYERSGRIRSRVRWSGELRDYIANLLVCWSAGRQP